MWSSHLIMFAHQIVTSDLNCGTWNPPALRRVLLKVEQISMIMNLCFANESGKKAKLLANLSFCCVLRATSLYITMIYWVVKWRFITFLNIHSIAKQLWNKFCGSFFWAVVSTSKICYFWVFLNIYCYSHLY